MALERMPWVNPDPKQPGVGGGANRVPNPNNPGRPNTPGRPPRRPPRRPGRPNPTPPMPIIDDTTKEKLRSLAGVKPATPDIIEFDTEALDVETLGDLYFENIGGQELISIARNDIINGQTISYQPIRNINSLANRYNSQNILFIPQTAYSFFNNFPLKFVNYLPNVGTGPEGESVYLDNLNNIIINLVNIRPSEEVEVQVFDQPNIFSGTIYGGDS
jgi:hypothetical protein